MIDRGDFHVALVLFFQQFFTGLEYIARADGQNKVARTGDARLIMAGKSDNGYLEKNGNPTPKPE